MENREAVNHSECEGKYLLFEGFCPVYNFTSAHAVVRSVEARTMFSSFDAS